MKYANELAGHVPIHVVFYEDIKSNMEDELTKLSDFLQKRAKFVDTSNGKRIKCAVKDRFLDIFIGAFLILNAYKKKKLIKKYHLRFKTTLKIRILAQGLTSKSF